MNSRKIMMFLSIVVAVTMMLPMIVLAKGENETITIKPPDSGTWVLNASDFSAIKLFDVSVQSVDGSPRFVYTPADGVESFAADFADGFGDGTANGLRIWLSGPPSAADLKTFTKAVMDFGFTSSGSVSGGGAAGNVIISDLDFGYYLVVGSGHADGTEVFAHSALVTVPEFADGVQKKTVEITLKADAPTIAKTVSNENTSNQNDFVKWTDVSIGDIVTFKIESIVPNMFGYDSYTFKVHDTMDAGLSFVGTTKADFTVTIGGKSFNQFEVEVSEDKQTIALTMQGSIDSGNSGDFRHQVAGDAIVITYQAMLNETATIDKTPNVNTARIEYSNNPYWDGKGKEPTGTTPEDKAKVFVFDFDILKFTGSLDTPIPLAGAEFELRTVEDKADSAIKLVGPTSEKVDGEMMDVYRVATPKEIADDEFTTIIVTGELGRVLIRGLDAGDYFLQETKAPDGFNLREAAVKVSIVRVDGSGDEVVYDEAFDGSTKVYADKIEGHTVNVENNAGPELPGTGGAGRTVIYACGGTLLVGILIAYAISKRRKEED